MAQPTLAPDIRGVTIPISGASVLLPNACVSEVITYGTPRPLAGGAPWVLGVTSWRGWQMPLFSLAMLAGTAASESVSSAKVAVLKAFGGVHKMPYMALLTQGFPRLTTITADRLVVEDVAEVLPDGVLFRVTVGDEAALVPDLAAIEGHLLELMAPQVRGPVRAA